MKAVRAIFKTDALLTDFPEYYSNEEIEKMRDTMIKPFLFNEKWIPFAQYCNSCYLMLDFDPGEDGDFSQVICYIHDPDEIIYVSKDITELVESIVGNL